MTRIEVPKQYKSELRNTSSPEYKIAQIRDYIKANPDKVIKSIDFIDLVGSTGPSYVNKLRKKGNIIRYRIKSNSAGPTYGYRWNDQPNVIDTGSGGVKIKKMGFEEWPLKSEEATRALDRHVRIFVDDNLYTGKLSGDEIRGVLKFNQHMGELHDQVKEQHAEALNLHVEKQASNGTP